jgi:hypothetical protein
MYEAPQLRPTPFLAIEDGRIPCRKSVAKQGIVRIGSNNRMRSCSISVPSAWVSRPSPQSQLYGVKEDGSAISPHAVVGEGRGTRQSRPVL